jgi:hypothetical protein
MHPWTTTKCNFLKLIEALKAIGQSTPVAERAKILEDLSQRQTKKLWVDELRT